MINGNVSANVYTRILWALHISWNKNWSCKKIKSYIYDKISQYKAKKTAFIAPAFPVEFCVKKLSSKYIQGFFDHYIYLETKTGLSKTIKELHFWQNQPIQSKKNCVYSSPVSTGVLRKETFIRIYMFKF